MKKSRYFVSLALLLLIFLVGYVLYFRLQNKEIVIYTKEIGTSYNNRMARFIAAKSDGSGKRTITEYSGTIYPHGLFLIPDKKLVVVVDYIRKLVQQISIDSGEQKTLYKADEGFRIDYGLLSPLKDQMILSINPDFDREGIRRGRSGKIVLLDFSQGFLPKIIKENLDYFVSIRTWDSAGGIYLDTLASKGCNYTNDKVLDLNKSSIMPTAKSIFYAQEDFTMGAHVISPEGSHYASFEQNENSPLADYDCNEYGTGKMKIYSVNENNSYIVEDDAAREFSFYRWFGSDLVAYKVTKWSDRAMEHKNIAAFDYKNFEKYVVYNLVDKSKNTFLTEEEMQKWLRRNYPTEHFVKVFASTGSQPTESKNFYLDGRIIDTVDPLPWNVGRELFNVLGFLKK